MSMGNTIFASNGDNLPEYIKAMSTIVPGTTNTEEYKPAYELPTSATDVANGIKSQLIRGTMTFSKDKLRQLDPSYTGYTQVFVLRMPEFMKQVADGNVITGFAGSDQSKIAKYHYENLRAMLELGTTSYSGTPDLTLNTATVNVGWAEKNYSVPTYSAYEATSFTLTVLETRREPLRRALEYYISGMADPNAKIAHLHGAKDSVIENAPMEPSLSNTTFAFMIVQTDQTLRNIQDVSIWTNAIPTSVPRSHMDWTLGEVDIVQPYSLSFNGIYLPNANSAAVYNKARKLMAIRAQYYKRLDELNATEFGADDWNASVV